MKICIPSKERAESMTTHLFFNSKDVLIFVEPHEVKKYQIFWPEYNIVDIKKSNQGLAYVRNFILDYIDEPKLVMADDDISFFGKRNDKHRYDRLSDYKEMLKDIEKGLDSFWGYEIPNNSYSFFLNKNSDNKIRMTVNNKYVSVFYGINNSEFKKHNIIYDPLITSDGDDIDISIQILLNDGKICHDYKYCLAHEINTSGGLANHRKESNLSRDMILRECATTIAKKYGVEFVKISHDSKGYARVCSFNTNLLKKRKEVVKKNYEKYLTKI